MRQLKITKSITNRESQSLEKYLQEIGKVDLLTPDEEVELAKRIKEGDQVITGPSRILNTLKDGAVVKQQVKKEGEAAILPLIMKVPLLFSTDDPTAIVAFEVEQMIMPKLKGVHVPRYFGAGDFDAQAYIVMEHIAGVSLRSRFDAAPLPVAEVVNTGIKIAQALQDLHRQHVIHLDIKPSNIMFRPDGAAVLIDYGLSRHDKLPDLLDEEFRLPMGTGPYISPEQVLGVRNEPRSDLFALGVLLYHLATGERPFGHPTSVSGLKKRLYRDPIPPRSHNPAIPSWLQEVILRCLEVEPAARFDTAAQLAFLLQDPAQIQLTARAEKTAQDGYMAVLKRRFQAAGAEPLLIGETPGPDRPDQRWRTAHRYRSPGRSG